MVTTRRLTITPQGAYLFRKRVNRTASDEAILTIAKDGRRPTDVEVMRLPSRVRPMRQFVRVVGNVGFLIRGNEVRSAWRFR